MKGLGILCPGQGNQDLAMFDILTGHPAAESVMQSTTGVLGCHPVEYLNQIGSGALFSNRAAQLLICTLQMATWAALRELLPTPRVFAGYSMGELSTYGCTGALDSLETLRLMAHRAELMDAATPEPAGLLAVRGLVRDEVAQLCRSTGAEVAIVNAPDHFVLGGKTTALTACEQNALAGRAVTLKRLQVSVPSHTSMLHEAGAAFADILQHSSLQGPNPPVIAVVSGSVVRTRDDAITALVQQISHTINWAACMQTVMEMGCNVILELGPGNALTKMWQEAFPGTAIRSVADFRSLQGVTAWVQKQLS